MTRSSVRLRGRGFTLIELVIGVTLSIIVVGAVTAVLATVLVDNKRQRVQSEMQRDAMFLNALLAKEIRQAGMGVPTGGHVDDVNYGTAPRPVTFAARRILLAAPTALVIVGDLARPDSTYASFGTLSTHPTGPGLTRVCWHTENNGSCCRQSPGDTCDFSDASIFFADDATDCTSGSARRTCPWFGRVVQGDRLQIVDGTGLWSHAQVSTGSLNASTGNNVVSLPLQAPSVSLAAALTASWANTAPGDPPGGLLGQGFVTSLDRVIFRFDTASRRLLRRHCLGDPDPNGANWPPSGATALPASLVVSPADGAASTCFPEETVARDVQTATFTYFNGTSAAVVNPNSATLKNSIRRVEWEIVLRRFDAVTGPNPVLYEVKGAVALQNIQVGEP